ARDVLRRGPALGQNRDDIGQGLFDLDHKVLAFELLARIPSDLAGDEQEAPFGDYAVAEALGFRPMLGVEPLHHPSRAPVAALPLSLKRWILPVSVFSSAAMNLIERGYL